MVYRCVASTMPRLRIQPPETGLEPFEKSRSATVSTAVPPSGFPWRNGHRRTPPTRKQMPGHHESHCGDSVQGHVQLTLWTCRSVRRYAGNRC